MDDEQARFSIDELADLGGVSRRTVRYYVQDGPGADAAFARYLRLPGADNAVRPFIDQVRKG